MNINTHIITIGDEILIGQIIDTNSSYISSELTKAGFTIKQICSIADNKTDIVNQVTISMQKADLVIVTGGLGPTNDDITKKTLAELFNTPLVFSQSVYTDVEAFLIKRGSTMNSFNKSQAFVPQNATILQNKQGTAPGMMFNNNGKILISLPGVPHEMKNLLQTQVLPLLNKLFKLPFNYYKSTLVTGIAEAHLAEKLSQWEAGLPKNISLAYLPSPGIIKLRLGMQGNNFETIKTTIDNYSNQLNNILGNNIFGYNDQTLEEIVGNLLKKHNKTVSTAESCTGGQISSLLTSIPGSSQWYTGSIIAYNNNVKINHLKVLASDIEKHGAVSKQVVEQMAQNIRQQYNTDYSVAVSGIAGPDGGTAQKPVGTVYISIAGSNGCISQLFTFGNERLINIQRASLAALNMLRLYIINQT